MKKKTIKKTLVKPVAVNPICNKCGNEMVECYKKAVNHGDHNKVKTIYKCDADKKRQVKITKESR